MKLNHKLATCLVMAGCLGAVAQASPAGAENDAYEMAVRQTQAGFTIYPGASGNLQPGEKTMPLMMPVTAGVTYTFLIGVDERVADVDLYVFDEQGNEILVDDRTDRRAGTKFVAPYTGTALVTVLMNSTRLNRETGKYHGLASWALLVGTRGGPQQERYKPTNLPGDNNEKARDTEPKTEQGITD
ncbi:FimB/Mfa2 family fimbrial subunit [Luteolibacter sp. GHJ8]|jgi:hypothetical protein|uniref:FimB/Mfa2 family fimbrial subunit n=1 Tax=Luteolibacter rhizosphaerae TaxID=2989719 RepID=A0ABT3G4K0_9BACT|nr:FimB/Mfa2 family fimbrial subunit [Luteolibacter rhizosphaerae]MCW1914785.1 FimB/Mfa2 family fimbrial subunit [Luteolibacter rhizosphaerae]